MFSSTLLSSLLISLVYADDYSAQLAAMETKALTNPVPISSALDLNSLGVTHTTMRAPGQFVLSCQLNAANFLQSNGNKYAVGVPGNIKDKPDSTMPGMWNEASNCGMCYKFDYKTATGVRSAIGMAADYCASCTNVGGSFDLPMEMVGQLRYGSTSHKFDIAYANGQITACRSNDCNLDHAALTVTPVSCGFDAMDFVFDAGSNSGNWYLFILKNSVPIKSVQAVYTKGSTTKTISAVRHFGRWLIDFKSNGDFINSAKLIITGINDKSVEQALDLVAIPYENGQSDAQLQARLQSYTSIKSNLQL